nr:11886_t:CDS:2 [Entrophospora candida]
MSSKKLIFKGDKERKKKKKRKVEETKSEEDVNDDGWVLAESKEDLMGPLFFIFNSEPLSCLHCFENDHSIGVKAIPPKNNNLANCEPEEVNAVFVGASIVGSSSDHRITLKTYDGKYLASDKFGVITADREAIGPQEEWIPIIRDDGIALQSYYDKFLSVDEIAADEEGGGGGGNSSGSGRYKLRADVETIGFCETWKVKCQARLRKKQKITQKETKSISEFEVDQIKKYQAWGGGKVNKTHEDVTELKKAKKEGKFAEALLDRRAKVKADRYCK